MNKMLVTDDDMAVRPTAANRRRENSRKGKEATPGQDGLGATFAVRNAARTFGFEGLVPLEVKSAGSPRQR